MKKKLTQSILVLALAWLCSAPNAYAQLNIAGADASDGDLVTPVKVAPTTIVIDLSLAATGNWDMPSPMPGQGVYDPTKWAVVFKYNSVNIRTNVTVVFKNHPSRAPVVWLVSGDVTIAGQLNLSGNPPDGINPEEPGPGGFRGGTPAVNGVHWGAGFGPGGGNANQSSGEGWGSYSVYEVSPGGPATLYGNNQIVPLVGGSGSGAISDGRTGNSGGGAILIATKQSIAVDGQVVSVSGPYYDNNHWRGSGGAIRLIANQILGSGTLDVASTGAPGRIRLETPSYLANLGVFPPTLAVPPDSPPLIWPRDPAPTVRVVSVGGKNAPLDPLANLDTSGADISMQNDQPVDIQIETKNLDVSTAVVTARVTARNGAAFLVNAQLASGTTAQATWIATTTIPAGFAAVQVRAVSQ